MLFPQTFNSFLTSNIWQTNLNLDSFPDIANMSPETLAFLRLLPVLSSTTILMFAFDEYLFLSRFMNTTYRTESNAFLAKWFTQWLAKAKWVIISLFPFSLGTALANIFTSRKALQMAGAEKWYWCGFAFQFGHFLFAPIAVKLLNDISGDKPKGDVTSSMKKWLRMHAIRTFVVDIPAWAFFITANVMAR